MRFIYSFIICLLLPIPGRAQVQGEARISKGGIRKVYLSDNPRLTTLDSLVEGTVKNYMQSPQNCGLSIGLSVAGKTYFYNYGELWRDSRRLPGNGSVYEIGAVTGIFTGLLLAQAITEGKISLDDQVKKYFPGKLQNLSYKDKPILIRHLVSHTAGFPRVPDNLRTQPAFDSLNPFKNYSKSLLISYLGSFIPASQPGQIYEYSATGLAMLGYILEEVYRSDFKNLVEEKIIRKNELACTGIFEHYENKSQGPRGYDENGEPQPHWSFGQIPSAGGISSCTKDLLKLMDRLQSNDTLSKLVTQTVHQYRPASGLGWFLKKTKQGNSLYWQNGGTGGFSAFTGFIKEKRISVVVLANSGMSLDFIALALLNYLQH